MQLTVKYHGKGHRELWTLLDANNDFMGFKFKDYVYNEHLCCTNPETIELVNKRWLRLIICIAECPGGWVSGFRYSESLGSGGGHAASLHKTKHNPIYSTRQQAIKDTMNWFEEHYPGVFSKYIKDYTKKYLAPEPIQMQLF